MRKALTWSLVGATVVGAVLAGIALVDSEDMRSNPLSSTSQAGDRQGIDGRTSSVAAEPVPKSEINRSAALLAPDQIRREFLSTNDLYALYQVLIASDSPGAQLYAVAALSECSTLKGHFGVGSDAWSRFNALVPEGAPDRSVRVQRFKRMQDRCRGFGDTRVKLAFDGLEKLFREPSRDPFAQALAILTQAGAPGSKSRATNEFASAAKFALESRDPELLAALASAWTPKAPRRAELRPDEEALALRLGWTLAIESTTEAAPASLVEIRNANCITGKGCELTSVTETYRRHMSDRPADRVAMIVANGESLVPALEEVLKQGRIEPFLRSGG